MKNILKSVAFFLIALVVAFVVATCVRFVFMRPVSIVGKSMSPTFADGEVVYVNTKKSPSYYDICIFFVAENRPIIVKNGEKYSAHDFAKSMPFFGKSIKTEGQKFELYVKRIVGLAGDTIEFVPKTVDGINYIFLRRNGEIVNEKITMLDGAKMDEKTSSYYEENKQNCHICNVFSPITVQNDEVFVLGDNRSASFDSRVFGCVPLSSILGICR